jgi:hypothetical protein
MTSGATSHVTSRVTCRGTRTRGVGEVVDDEPARDGVVNDERRDEPRDEPRDVPRHPDAWHRQSSRQRAYARRSSCRMDLPGPTTSVGTRTDYSVGPWDYLTCAARYLMV